MKVIRSLIYSIKNIIRWIPILWNDRDWDGWYIFTILEFKLKNQYKHLKEHNSFVGVERDCERIATCISLLKKVKDEEYLFGSYQDMMEYEKAIIKHDKAKRILFTLLERNIERWWD